MAFNNNTNNQSWNNDSQDSLLWSIAEEYVEGVEILLQHEEKIHGGDKPYVIISCFK